MPRFHYSLGYKTPAEVAYKYATVYDTSKIPPVGIGSMGVADLSEMAEYKYPNPSCAEQYSFAQFG